MILGKQEKEELLGLAREAIEDQINPRVREHPRFSARSPVLDRKCGAFVSLYVHDKLRGCIGTFSEEVSVRENVKQMAIFAATTDSRFDPILPEELDKLSIEISILTPRTRIYDISDIEIGKHGIFMIHGMNRGTLLPQVAVSQNWDVFQLLGNCSRYKAGLGWEGWKTAELYTYEAIVFNSPPPH
jgi:AmmeMemoRadiSam system protein A